MVISPRQAAMLTAEEKKKVEELERMIDYGLQRGNRSFSANCNEKVRQELEKMYSEVGWQIKYESSQRDGGYFSFRERQNSQRDSPYSTKLERDPIRVSMER